jgi:putative transposase
VDGQPLVEAFPWQTAPRYLLRDCDAVYEAVFSSLVQALGIHEVKIAPRSRWQNPYFERLIGTLRRETHLRRLLRDIVRPHQALANNCPQPRVVEPSPRGQIITIQQAGQAKGNFDRHSRFSAELSATTTGRGRRRPVNTDRDSPERWHFTCA